MPGARFYGFREAAVENKAFMDKHPSLMEGLTTDAKRRWKVFSSQVENDLKDNLNRLEAKHYWMELLFQKCLSTVDEDSEQSKRTHASVDDMSRKNVKEINELVRSVIESNERHTTKVASALCSAEEDISKTSKDILHYFDGVMNNERELTAQVMTSIEAHSHALHQRNGNHATAGTSINDQAEKTFQSAYMDYKPSGETLIMLELDVPSIELLRTVVGGVAERSLGRPIRTSPARSQGLHSYLGPT